MKRFITLCVILMGVALTVAGIVKMQSSDATHDISSGLSVLANQSGMAKSAMVNEKMVFSEEDFKKSLNLSEIGYITLTSVPSIADGCLCIGDTVLSAGQSISGNDLDLLNFRAADGGLSESEFCFKVNGCEYEMTCNMYFRTRENTAPVILDSDERLFSVSTHQSTMIYGRVRAHDRDGDDIRYEIVTYARCGVIELDPLTGEYTYTPMGNFYGEDSFEYVAVDKYGEYSASRKVSVTVERRETDVYFADMQGNRAHHAALTMMENGIMDGETVGGSTYFMPDKSVSRVDFIFAVMNSLGMCEVEHVFDTGFDDDSQIPEQMKGFVKKARDMGIMDGNVTESGEYLFEPNREITRAEAAVILNNIVKGSAPIVKPTFTDRDEIPAFASDAIYTLNHLGMLPDERGEISPNKSLTRGALAEMLYVLRDLINN